MAFVNMEFYYLFAVIHWPGRIDFCSVNHFVGIDFPNQVCLHHVVLPSDVVIYVPQKSLQSFKGCILKFKLSNQRPELAAIRFTGIHFYPVFIFFQIALRLAVRKKRTQINEAETKYRYLNSTHKQNTPRPLNIIIFPAIGKFVFLRPPRQ